MSIAEKLRDVTDRRAVRVGMGFAAVAGCFALFGGIHDVQHFGGLAAARRAEAEAAGRPVDLSIRSSVKEDVYNIGPIGLREPAPDEGELTVGELELKQEAGADIAAIGGLVLAVDTLALGTMAAARRQ